MPGGLQKQTVALASVCFSRWIIASQQLQGEKKTVMGMGYLAGPHVPVGSPVCGSGTTLHMTSSWQWTCTRPTKAVWQGLWVATTISSIEKPFRRCCLFMFAIFYYIALYYYISELWYKWAISPTFVGHICVDHKTQHVFQRRWGQSDDHHHWVQLPSHVLDSSSATWLMGCPHLMTSNDFLLEETDGVYLDGLCILSLLWSEHTIARSCWSFLWHVQTQQVFNTVWSCRREM